MKKIKECPFCGNKKAPTIVLASENQEAGIEKRKPYRSRGFTK